MYSPILRTHAKAVEEKGGLRGLVAEVMVFARSFCDSPGQEEEEVCQRVMEKIAKSDAVPKALSKNWLWSVTRHAYWDYLREQQRYARLVDRDVVLSTTSTDEDWGNQRVVVPAVCEDREPDAYDQVAWVVASLPPKQKQAVLLVAAGLSYEQAAAVANVSAGTIRSRIHYARKELREALTAGSK